VLADSPGDDFYIESIVTHAKGFIIAGINGIIMIYEKIEDLKLHYRNSATLPNASDSKIEREFSNLLSGIMATKIKSLALSMNEDTLFFTTDNQQLMKCQVQLERPSDDARYEYVIFPFHIRNILGMDTCIKKKQVATCSYDKTVRVWNYEHQTLEICEVFTEEAYSVAFHPSGFHILVGFSDKLRMMNVFQKSLKRFGDLPIKSCREIQFSHGGHLFAAATANHIQVYSFYTAESPPEFQFKGHQGRVKSIAWLEDDSGFISCGWNGDVIFFKL
jgi:WD40 repeat protein